MTDLPAHVAVIMDGNGRWASKRGLPRLMGHRKGAEAARSIVAAAADIGISHLTLYAFSSENWERPKEEVEGLMDLLRRYIASELEYFQNRGARLRVLGDVSRLPQDVAERLSGAEAATSGGSAITVNIALNYGGRMELAAAARKIAEAVTRGHLTPDDIKESTVAEALYMPEMPEPDLLIRTGGEKRISNFLLWQLAYAELYFTDTLWPDFGAVEFKAAIEDYANRERRYGRIRQTA